MYPKLSYHWPTPQSIQLIKKLNQLCKVTKIPANKNQGKRILSAFFLISATMQMLACGSAGRSNDGPSDSRGPIMKSFSAEAINHNLPEKMLLAVAYSASGLSNETNTTSYEGSEKVISLLGSATIFGVSGEVLGLDTKQQPWTIEEQIASYSTWLNGKLEQKGIELDPNIPDHDSLYDWIWNIAQIHLADKPFTKNIKILFALELLKVLNEGFTWQSDETGEMIQLQANPNPITSDLFSSQIQNNLTLDLQKSEIFSIDYLQVNFAPITEFKNKPSRIRVVHCPLSLSNCLSLQATDSSDKNAIMQAHYIIPQNQTLLENPVKIRPHQNTVLFTDTNGENNKRPSEVIIMLTGKSGRYSNGERVEANPSWYTNYQLKSLGKVIQGACSLMKVENPKLDLQSCKNPSDSKKGPIFQNQSSANLYRWGDIPDFDEDIFWTFVKNPDDPGGQVEFDFQKSSEVVNSGEPISFNLNVITGTSKIVIEFMERCENNKLVWTTLETRFVRNVDQQTFDFSLYEKGPNGDGQHFLRAFAYNRENTLIAWSTASLHLTNYEEESTPTGNLKQCERLGT